MLDNRKVLQDRLITTESNLNTIIAKLEQQLMETEKKLKGMEKVVEFPLPEHQWVVGWFGREISIITGIAEAVVLQLSGTLQFDRPWMRFIMLCFSKTVQHQTCSVTKAAVPSYSIAGYIITCIQYSISEAEICYCRFMTQGVHVWEATTTNRYPLHRNESVVFVLSCTIPTQSVWSLHGLGSILCHGNQWSSLFLLGLADLFFIRNCLLLVFSSWQNYNIT